MPETRLVTSIIVPAHNEAAVICRLLDGMLRDARPGEFEVIVVVNGSTDETAALARERGVRVVELDQASKHRALVEGDRLATGFPAPRVPALAEPGIHAVAPERTLVLEGSAWLVRAHYQMWDRLPAVPGGLFGRGVLGVDEAGCARIAARPELIGDDVYLHSRFAPGERRIVAGSRSVVRGPRTTADLVRRRTRAAQANTQLGGLSGGATISTNSSARTVAGLAVREPRLRASVPVFVGVTAYARVHAKRLRRSDKADVWLRDESSRT